MKLGSTRAAKLYDSVTGPRKSVNVMKKMLTAAAEPPIRPTTSGPPASTSCEHPAASKSHPRKLVTETFLGDADVDYAVDAAAWGAFLHQGEICMSTERIIIEKNIADEFTEKLKKRALAMPMGDPTNPATAIGPLINQRAVEKVHAHVEEAVAGGADLVAGGQYDNLVYHPTVVRGVKPDMRLFREQTFGPVAPIVVVRDPEEALAVANNSDYGLSAGILTNDFTRGLDVALRLETGMVHIGDQTINDEPQAPFGGVKGSGYGRFGGQAALDEFTELRWINVQRVPRTFP